MSLRDYIRVLRKRWRLIVAAVIVCLLAGSAYLLTSTKKYEATAQIFVSTAGANDTTAADLAQGNTFTQARVQSYTSVANSQSVTDAVVKQLGLSISSEALANEISADAPLNKVLINLHVTDRDPAQAARLANAVASQFSTVVEELEQTTATQPSPVKLTVTHPAQIPTSASSPNPKLDIALAVLAGLVLGLGLAFLRDMLDNTAKDPDELAAYSALPVLGMIPWDNRAGAVPISFRADAHGSRAEGYRQLRTNLQFVDIDNPPKVIAVTSALPQEGKSHTALNLSAALAEAGQRVCLIEADLRKPSLAEALGVVGDVGLTSVLIGRASLADVVQRLGDNLEVLVAGAVPPNPSELLNSEAFRHTLRSVRTRVDTVVIDTAPLLPVADGALIAALADATVLVVRAAKTTHDQIAQAIKALGNVDVTPVGVILSMARNRRSGGYYYQEYRPNRHSHASSENATERTTTKS